MAFRFIHTADIHLDSPLVSLAMRNGELAEVVANATRQVLERIVDLCLSEKVDALLIAGDLYDGDQTSMKTARFLASQLRKLNEANIRVFIIRGNHDAESKITRELTLPSNVHVFGSKADSITLQPTDADNSPFQRPVVIHGASFKKPHAPSSLLPLYKQRDPNAINIGMMHTSLDGASGHDLYAPCPLADLQNHGFDYWALGHIHKRAVYINDDCTVVMPGIPQGRDIGESGAKSVTLVSASDDGSMELVEHQLSMAQFEEIEVNFDNLQEWSEGIDLVMREIDRLFDTCVAEHLVSRIVLTGKTTLAWKLRRDIDLFEQEINSRFEDEGRRWLDKLILKCEPPTAEKQSDEAGVTPYEELHSLMIDEISQSPAFRNKAKLIVDDFLKLLPPELREKYGDNDEALDKNIEILALQGSAIVAANLQPADTDAQSAFGADEKASS